MKNQQCLIAVNIKEYKSLNKLLKALMMLTAIMLIGSVVVYAELKGTSHSNRESNKEQSLENKYEVEQADQGATELLQVAEVPNTENRLYPLTEVDGIYDGFTLAWEGQKTEFEWKSVASKAAPPELLSADITSDGTKDAIITLPLGYGTGVYVEDIHVVNGMTLKEERVEDAAEAAKQWAAENLETLEQQGELIMNHIDYQMNQQEQLIAMVGVAVSPLEYIGELTLKYVYDANENLLRVDSVTYTAIE